MKPTKSQTSMRVIKINLIVPLVSLLLIVGLGMAGCEGPEGPTGAQGEQGQQGPQGEQGPQGPSGEDGNANVLLYEFGEQTFIGQFSLKLSVSKETVDSSLVLVYYNPSNQVPTAWYPVPGIGGQDSYQTRYYIYQTSIDPSVYTLTIRLMQPDGSGMYGSSVTFTKVKVIFAEASSIFSAKAKSQIDLRDYNAVKAFYGIPD